jgi:serine phosphatase RsbU (regulator of sigma subunit)
MHLIFLVLILFSTFPDGELNVDDFSGSVENPEATTKQLKQLETFLEKAEWFYHRYQKDSSRHYFKQALTLADTTKFPQEFMEASYSLAHLAYETDRYDTALVYLEQARIMALKKDNAEYLVKTLGLKCEVYNYLGNNDLAIRSCMDCLEMQDKEGITKGKANVLNVIGNIYIQMNSFNKACSYLQQALITAKEENNDYDIATTLISFGELNIEKMEYDSALQFFEQAKQYDLKTSDTLGIAFTYYEIGRTLIKMDSVAAGIQTLEQALNFARIVQDYDLEANILSEKGLANSYLNNYEQAIADLNLSLTLAEKINASPLLKECYKNLANFHDITGDQSQALIYYKMYTVVSEHLYQREFAQKIAEAEIEFDIRQKEKQIQVLRQENKIQALLASKQDLLNKELIGAVAFFLVLAGVLYSRNRIKNKTNRLLQEQKTAMTLQNEEIEAQRSSIELKNVELADKNKQITDSIEYAKRIQLSLMPDSNALKRLFPDSFVFFKPKDIVSGDFYWLASRSDKVYLAVIDCTGHGVPGAFMTVMAHTLLNQIILENKISSPSVAITLLDLKVQQNIHHKEKKLLSEDMMDLGLCIIDKKTNKVEFAGARFSMFVSGKNKVQEIKGDRFSIGSADQKDKHFTTHYLDLSVGDYLYLATDGYPDQFGGSSDSKFLKVNFRKLLEEISRKSILEQYNFLADQFHHWKGNNVQTDDVLVIGIRI